MNRFLPTLGALLLALTLLGAAPALADPGKGNGGGNSGQGGGNGGGNNSDNGNHGDGNNGGGKGGDAGETAESPAAGDHDTAKHAVDASQALPLDVVLEKFHRLGNFTVIDVKLAQRSANLLYVFKYIDGGGTVHKALLDARTGDVIR